MATGAVISGATRGRGGPALGRHLADRRRVRQNEAVRLGAARGIVSEGIEEAVGELTRIVSHARSKQPLYHVHLDPELPWTKQQHERYWRLFEEEFGFRNQPFVEAIHIKHGRAHDHRVYSRVRRDGTVIPLKFDYARREKLGRIVELEFGGRHIAGRHNRAVAAALKREGRLDVLRSIEAAGLTTIARPVADMTPDERHQAERTGIDPRVIASVALAVWQDTVTSEDFVATLVRQGLRLAMGRKGPVLVDLAGGTHFLTKVIGKASAATGMRIKAKEVRARIENLKLPFYPQEEGAHYDESQNSSAASLDTQDYRPPVETEARPRRRLARKSSVDRGASRRVRLDRTGGGDFARAEQHRDDEKPVGAIGDASAGRAHQPRKNCSFAGGDRESKWTDHQRPSGSRRAVGRARTADHRLEGILDEPEFRQPIDRIVAWTALLDPGSAMRQRAEEGRVEEMLNEAEFNPAIGAIEALALWLVRLLAWLFEVLFGSDDPIVGQDTVVEPAPMAATEPDLPAPR